MTAAGLRGTGTAAHRRSGAASRRRWPNDRMERALVAEGFDSVGGLDEVGRGAWAGPVSVGVVVIPVGRRAPKGLCDSKLLTEEQREALFPKVTAWCTAWAVGHAEPVECDRWGMTVALRLAAHRALAGLEVPPPVVALDGPFDYVTGPPEPTDSDPGPATTPLPEVRTVVKGDLTCVSIAAASVVAKVTRDRMMRAMAPSFPGFDFDRNKGYPSPVHRTALAGFGLTSLHRRSWSYVDQLAFR